MTERRDRAARWWRPVGQWALTLNASLGFPALVAIAFLQPEGGQLPTLVGAYTTVLATWAVAAGIRQWGKNNGVENVRDE